MAGETEHRPYHHGSFRSHLHTQLFLSRKSYEVYSHTLKDKDGRSLPGEGEVFALYTPKQYRKLKHKPRIAGVVRINDYNLAQVFWHAWKEYLWGWRTQLAKVEECGCRTFRGKRTGVFCSAEHMFEGLNDGDA